MSDDVYRKTEKMGEPSEREPRFLPMFWMGLKHISLPAAVILLSPFAYLIYGIFILPFKAVADYGRAIQNSEGFRLRPPKALAYLTARLSHLGWEEKSINGFYENIFPLALMVTTIYLFIALLVVFISKGL